MAAFDDESGLAEAATLAHWASDLHQPWAALPAAVLHGAAVRRAPGQWAWRCALADDLEHLGDWDAALQALDPPGLEPNPQAQWLAVYLLARAGRTGEARQRLDGLWSGVPAAARQHEVGRPSGVAERMCAALWQAGRHRELRQMAEAVPAGPLVPVALAVAKTWAHLLRGQVAEARALMNPARAATTALGADTPLRFAHRGIGWLVQLALAGVDEALAVLPPPAEAVVVPATFAQALADGTVIDGWAGVVVLGACRDADAALCRAAVNALALRGSPAWRGMLLRLAPDNSPSRVRVAALQALALVKGDPAALEQAAREATDAARARLQAREAFAPAVLRRAELEMREILGEVRDVLGPAVASDVRQAWDAALPSPPRPQGQTARPTHVDLKVALLSRRASRTIRLPLSATLHDLHGQIQDAFQWDDEHVYGFGFGESARHPGPLHGGQPWDEQARPDEVLETLALQPGQRFWYLFGGPNVFSVTVAGLPALPPGTDPVPRVLASFGGAPEQYPSW